MGRTVGKEPCPSCRDDGGDRSGDNLTRYEDGGALCFVCGYKEFKGGNKQKKQEVTVESKNTDLSIYHTLPIIPVHGVSRATCEKFGVKVSVNESTRQPESVFYPYYSEDNKLVACKVRNLETKAFHWIGQPSKTTMFGQQNIGQHGQMLVIVEGEKDAMAMTEMFSMAGKNYKVVSIRDGASLPKKGETIPKPDGSVVQNLDLLAKFSNVVVAMDADKAGEATALGIGELIAPITKVKMLTYPEGYKDAHDCLAGLYDLPAIPKQIMTILAESKDFTPEAIVMGCDIDLDVLMTPLGKGIVIPFKGLQNKMQGLRKGELTTLTSSSGAGKSTISRELAYSLVKGGYRVANIFLEETLEKTAQGFIAIDNNIPLARLRAYPDSISKDQYTDSYNDLIANDRNFFFKHFGSLDSEVLMNKMRYFAKALDVDFIFLDHLSVVISGSDEDKDERKLLDKICTKLASFCTETNVGVIMVVHLRKTNNGQKSASEGGMITLDDLRGSGGIAQLSFNVIAATRDTTATDDDKANIVQLWVLKNREWGHTGDAGKLCYNKLTGRLEEVPEY